VPLRSAGIDAVALAPALSRNVWRCGNASTTECGVVSRSARRRSIPTPDGTETAGGASRPPASIATVVSTTASSDTPPDELDRSRLRALPFGTSGGRRVVEVVVTAAAPLVAVPVGVGLVAVTVDDAVVVVLLGVVPLAAVLLVVGADPPQAASSRHTGTAASHRRGVIGPA
jgi:hypothetical protein